MFVAIEGIDGAGCETQAQNLFQLLKKNNHLPFFFKYPDYSRNLGQIIKEFLYQNKNLSPESQFLLYSLQFILDKEEIAKKRKKGIVIADRYFTSTLCYQTIEGINLKKAIRFAQDFKIEKPDLVFYLDVRPKIAWQRKHGEQKIKNRREKDFDFMKKTYCQYQFLVKNQIWAKWIKINGERNIDEITQDIYNNLNLKNF